MARVHDLRDQYEEIAATCALFATRSLSRATARIYDAALAEKGFKGTQYNVLVAIARRPAMSLTALAAMLGMDRTALTHALRPLARAGLVTDVALPDGRARGVRLTRLGEKRVAAAIPFWRAAQTQIDRAVGDEGWDELNRRLRQLKRAIQAAAV